MATLFINGYPLITENTSGTTVIASGAINQSGMLYSVIVPAASGEPSVQQVIDGQDSASGALAANFTDSAEASASGTAVALSGYSLTSETDYTMYLAVSGYDDGQIANVSGLEFTTPDITAPEFSSVTVSNITTSTATVTFNMNDAGSGYFIIVPTSEAVVPSEAKIKAGLNANGDSVDAGLYGSTAVTAGVDASVSATNLQYSTQYTIYAVGTDDGNNDTAISTGTFRAAVPAPGVPGRSAFNMTTRDIRRRRMRDINRMGFSRR